MSSTNQMQSKEQPGFWQDALKSFLTSEPVLEKNTPDSSSAGNSCGDAVDCYNEIQAELEFSAVARLTDDKISSSKTRDSNAGEHEQRKFTKLGFDSKLSQQKRRELALAQQKKRRDDILDRIRQLEGDSACSDSEAEDDEDFVKLVQRNSSQSTQKTIAEENGESNSEQMDTSTKKKKAPRRNATNRKKRTAPCRVMLSEWLTEKPEDFEDNWLGVLAPVGKRCLVVACRGKTLVFSRADEFMGIYRSLLPGGGRVKNRGSNPNTSSGVTILDCIWCEEIQVFYILDLICWNSISCNNCDKEFRQFFTVSKVSENPDLMLKSVLNPFPFLPLPSFSCDLISEVMTSPPIFKQKVDGVLFFHKQSFYFPGSNPLCLWAYLTEIEQLLKVSVSPELLSRQKPHQPRKIKQQQDMEL